MVSNTQAAGLALSAVVLAYAVHLSVALVALDHHRRGTEGWLVAVVATLFALVLPLDEPSACCSRPSADPCWELPT